MGSTARITDTGRKGDLRIAFGFERVWNGYEYTPEPHMYIHAAASPRQAAAVALRQMYLFDTRDRDPVTNEPKCLPACRRLAEAIYGMAPSKREVYRVLDAVQEFMTDLKNMPPPARLRNPDMLERVLATKGYDLVR